LGLGDHFNNETSINERITALNQQFHLVLLVERLEESLVLLRHLLCPPVEHVATLVLNKHNTGKTFKLKTWQRLVLKNWLRADHMIYDYFRKLFDSKVRQFNEEHLHLVINSSVTPMDIEVTKLRQAVAELNNKCVVDQVGNEKLTGKFHEFSNDVIGYEVKE
jgi:galactose-3-O-sulfotransferase 2